MTVEEQIIELRKKYPYLYPHSDNGNFLVKGTIFFEDETLKDDYEVEILISPRYPKRIPTAKEVGGKIPKEFHHYQDDTLCLETPFKVWEVFRQMETLINFADNLLVPYLYNYSCYRKQGKTPDGEWAHGAEGILADYKTRLNVQNDFDVLNLLRILVEDIYRGHLPCPCGNGNKLRKCHGGLLMKMKSTEYDFMMDYLMIMADLKKRHGLNARPYLSKKVQGILDKITNNPDKKW